MRFYCQNLSLLTWSTCMAKMPLPQPSTSERQQESGTALDSSENVVFVQSIYSWAPQHFSYKKKKSSDSFYATKCNSMVRPHYTILLILILKVWGFLRVTLKNSQILRWEWGESGLKILRVFEGDPQKPSKFEVRTRAMFLRLRVKISRWEWGFALRVFEKFSKILENSRSGWTIKSFWNNR